MRCPHCQTENPDQAKFCFNCGTVPAGPAPPPPSDSLETALRRLLPRGYAERLQAAKGRLGGEKPANPPAGPMTVTLLSRQICPVTACCDRMSVGHSARRRPPDRRRLPKREAI